MKYIHIYHRINYYSNLKVDQCFPPNSVLDLNLVVDSSMSETDFAAIRDFLSNLVGTFTIAPNRVKVISNFKL